MSRTSALSICLLTAFSIPALADIKVVASIKPIQSIAAAVMQSAGTPTLLVDALSSPHTYTLTPANAKAMQDAQLILWIGPELEAFLKKPMQSLGEKAKQIELMKAHGLKLYPVREAHSDGGEESHDQDSSDPHIWLSPANATVIANTIAAELASLDPEKSNLYNDNAAAFVKELEAAEATIKGSISALEPAKVVVFHDAYQYFEKHFGFGESEALSIHPENPPGAAALKAIREDIKADNVACVFAEPQFDRKLVDTVTEGTEVYVGTLDPYGSTLPEGPGHYIATLNALATDWRKCFG